MIDTHAHLDALEEPSEVVARAREAGVTRIVTIGTGIDSCRRALDLTAHHGVYAALGIDPHQAGTKEAARTAELRSLLEHPKAVAVGEAGLDYHYGADRKDEQRELFQAQLDLARELALPVVVHTRSANPDTEAILGEHEGAVVMHCFSEPELLDAGLARGAAVDHDREAKSLGEIELRLEQRSLLAQRVGAVMAVEPRLADGDDPRMTEELLQLVEPVGFRGRDVMRVDP